MKTTSKQRTHLDVAIDEIIGKRLEFLRKKAGYKTAQLAAKMGFHCANIRKYENAKMGLSCSKAILICRELQISPLILFQDFFDKYGNLLQDYQLEKSQKQITEVLNEQRTDITRETLTKLRRKATSLTPQVATKMLYLLNTVCSLNFTTEEKEEILLSYIDGFLDKLKVHRKQKRNEEKYVSTTRTIPQSINNNNQIRTIVINDDD